jgi:hypothetical protein
VDAFRESRRHASYSTRLGKLEVISLANCLNNSANNPINAAIQIYPINASDAAISRASNEGRTSPYPSVVHVTIEK